MALSDQSKFNRRIVASAVDGDAELAEKARALAHAAIDIATDYLTNGSPQTQLKVIQSIMPAIGRGMTEKGEDNEIAELRAQLAELHQAVLGQSVA